MTAVQQAPANLPSETEFERILREKYEPICTPDEYQRLRRKCGLGDLIEGEVASDGE